ncbi:A/G-specific adenine glycosylase [Mesoflavibacter sabulilitoris]|uniref:Adenine DNA glycosylase n=1 Tax=Mesoflavibacter zeaxanthinifaciens subsp. sabulilitoris TaxID=1520893 RepID=A0A2T1N7C0_9FLAO|nr:A/G-specific adenine glycosylase [Mesoflavibacter zeaxanthinifaciens]MBB3124155.1 A/G-specific adenine glycosylase [Mesoflavibacter zeaxanthinifaciens subsp. sabulilitoris]PSG87683.1 A/G-specific adenine glycosylase [Mesoflavibacter zeaxanthinifaciens subsp. sabulilitoris]
MNFSTKLINWYTVNKRDLPWRSTNNPYYIWLSEIILQQTQVVQGTPYYHAFTSQFPTVFDLANANEEDVLKLWQGLGYYSRARNLHWSAKYIVNELDGVFPDTYKDILKLKGVGDYTASAIASICFNEVTAVVDGNVYRALSRIFGIETPINSTPGQKEFKALAQQLIDKQQPAIFNQAIMEFGARQCKPKNPDCSVCPFKTSCLALKENKIAVLPVKLKKTKVTKKYFNFIVIISKNEKTILEQRIGSGIWQNLYQFPLIETEKPSTYNNIKSKIENLDVLADMNFDVHLYNDTDIIHKLSHQHLYTKFWIVSVDECIENGIDISNIKDYPVPILIGNFIDKFNF